jgi:hypothetical protein
VARDLLELPSLANVGHILDESRSRGEESPETALNGPIADVHRQMGVASVGVTFQRSGTCRGGPRRPASASWNSSIRKKDEEE